MFPVILTKPFFSSGQDDVALVPVGSLERLWHIKRKFLYFLNLFLNCMSINRQFLVNMDNGKVSVRHL